MPGSGKRSTRMPGAPPPASAPETSKDAAAASTANDKENAGWQENAYGSEDVKADWKENVADLGKKFKAGTKKVGDQIAEGTEKFGVQMELALRKVGSFGATPRWPAEALTARGASLGAKRASWRAPVGCALAGQGGVDAFPVRPTISCASGRGWGASHASVCVVLVGRRERCVSCAVLYVVVILLSLRMFLFGYLFEGVNPQELVRVAPAVRPPQGR
eukprot:3423152-Prymnesium_polylepis.1